jgi:hypothetical protein
MKKDNPVSVKRSVFGLNLPSLFPKYDQIADSTELQTSKSKGPSYLQGL